MENSKAQLTAEEDVVTEFGHTVRKLVKHAYPEAGNHMQDRPTKERFVEGIRDPQVRSKLRDLRPATSMDALDEACMLWDSWEAETQKAHLD